MLETLKQHFTSRFINLATTLLDAVYLALWLVTQWGVSRIHFVFPVFGWDLWMFWVFQFIFAVSTLLWILLGIYKDYKIMVIKIQREIKQEEENYVGSPSNTG